MATKTQRAQTMLDAGTNRIVPQSLSVQLADAMAREKGIDPASLTLTQKAELILAGTLDFWRATVKRAEGVPVAQAAVASNNAAIDAGFAEAP